VYITKDWHQKLHPARRFTMRICWFFFLVFATSVLVPQENFANTPQGGTKEPRILVNQDVLDMLKAGLPPDIVAAKIKASNCNFNTDLEALKELKDKAVADNVVLAMVQAPHSEIVPSDGKIRAFITDSQSWEVRGSWGASNGSGGGSTSGGARPQTAEIIKTFTERCLGVLVTNKVDMANYVVTLDHEGGKGLIRKDNKVAVFRKNGDAILSKSTRELGSSVKDACSAILSDANAASGTK
jgi:hypothetical protein